jgi:hypothetical protein
MSVNRVVVSVGGPRIVVVTGLQGPPGIFPETGFATGAQGELADSAVQPGVLDAALAEKAALEHLHALEDIVGLIEGLAGKAAALHGHALGHVAGLQEALDLKASLDSPTFTGTVGGITKAMVGLASVDNTPDTAKPVSVAQQAALDLKASIAQGALASSAVQPAALALKANIASPTFTGTVAGITKAMVGLSNVDNTTDAGKPVSTAQATAIALKAPLASPTFTGTVGGITKAMVGLASVDNTADASKPVSTAQQTALNGKATTEQGALADSSVQPGAEVSVLVETATAKILTAAERALMAALPAALAAKLESALYTAADVLSKLLGVDGPDSGLDADLLDGQQGSYYAPLESPNFTGLAKVTGITEQLRLGYDADKYASFAVDNEGKLTCYAQSNIVFNARATIGTINFASPYSALTVQRNVTGASNINLVYLASTVQADVTAAMYACRTALGTVADVFTLTGLVHYAASQGTIGVGSIVTSQQGYVAFSNIVGALTNYGFSSQLPIGPNNNWNFYAAGTAPNYMAGTLGIGSTTISAKLHVTATTEQLRLGYDATKYASFTVDSAGNTILSSSGLRLITNSNLTIGATPAAIARLYIDKIINGASSAYAIYINSVVQSDAISAGYGVRSQLGVQDVVFTTNLTHFFASQGTIGAAATVTNQYGYNVEASLIGATNNYGFYGNIPAAANRWNLYMSGTASNYINGTLAIGTTTLSAKLHVISTSEQLRIGYSTGFYASFIVASDGTLLIKSSSNKLRLSDTARTPASATAPGLTGETCFDSDFFYTCVAPNVWKRAALASW